MITLFLIVIIIAFIILAEFFIEKLYKGTTRYRSSLGGAGRFYDVPHGIEICNIGSGPGLYSIDYKLCKMKGFNFSTAPQNYKYGFRLLKRFADCIEENAIIIIVIMSPLSFANNKDYNRVDYSDKFYDFLDKEDIDGYSIKRKIIVDHPLLIKTINKVKPQKRITNDKRIANDKNEEELQIIKVWKREFDLYDLKDASQAKMHLEAFKDKVQILKDGIDYCYKMNWRPLLVIPPIPPKTKEYIGGAFLNRFIYDNLNEVTNSFDSLPVLDYYSLDMSEDKFQNDIFMNEKGKEFFSKQLFMDVGKEVGIENRMS